PDAAQLYKVVTEVHLPDGAVINEGGTPLALTKALKDQIPQVKKETVLLSLKTATISVPLGNQVKHFAEHGNIAFADANWFNMFSYIGAAGNAVNLSPEPGAVVITQRLAEKYFGNTNPIGKVVRLDNTNNLTVTDIIENYPGNTDLKFDMFIAGSSFRSFYPQQEADMSKSWGWINSTTQSFISLPGDVSVKRVEEAMARLVKEHFDPGIAGAYQFHLLPLKELHFDGRYGGVIRKSLLTTLALLGIFLVVIACFNFINMASAQSVKRAKEIGTRKVLGSTPAAIFWQFIAEISCVVLLATALAFVWMTLFLPVINTWLQTDLQINILHDRVLLPAILLLLLFVILASGTYPAIVLSRFKPLEALKSQKAGLGTAKYRRGLIVVQNMIVQGLIVCTLIIVLQVRHFKNADLGFNKNAVLMVSIPDNSKSKMTYLRNHLLTNPKIQSVSFCYQAPSSDAYTGGSVQFDNREWEDFSAGIIMGDSAYVKTFGLKLIAGTNLAESDTVNQVLINQSMLHRLGFNKPEQVLGHRLVVGGIDDRSATITGIVKDFNAHSLYTPIAPVLITTNRTRYRYAAITLAPQAQNEARNIIQKEWQAAYPQNEFEYRYLDEQIDEFYHKEDLLSKLVKTTTGIAIVISCLGLLGLISFVTLQRTKEIGIRKVLGAGVVDIVLLFSKDFLRLLIVSMVIIFPVAFFFMDRWLQDFAYRIHISWWIFGLAGIISMFIALATISFQSIKTALANPVKSLKVD
ncbi:MAG: hypothetical protein DI539_22470, partial [Flavobacterium psychrophilum]